MKDRSIILSALAGSAGPEDGAETVLAVAFEIAHAEANALIDTLEGQPDSYTLAIAHAGRLRALEGFISAHFDVTMRAETESEAAE